MSADTTSAVADPAVQLLYQFTSACDRFDYDGLLSLFAKPSKYRVQCRRNFERDGVLHIVNDDEKELSFRCMSHPPMRLEPTVHVIGNPRVERAGGECKVTATFAIDRNGVPTFSGEYRATIDESGEQQQFKELLVILEGDSVQGTVQIPI